MNERFIGKSHSSLVYQKKEGTKGSFYLNQGQRELLPERLSLGIFAQKRASGMDAQKVNEINGQYRRMEAGLYKGLNNGKIHTSIWKTIPDYPEFYGYGILDERYGIFDLLIVYSENVCSSSFEIHLLKGYGKPEYINDAFQYLRTYQKRSPKPEALRDIL